jgi:tight adherence protein B
VTEWLKDLPEGWPLILGAALVAVLLAESAYMLLFKAKEYRSNVNRRLAIQKEVTSREEALIQLRRERGLEDGAFSGPMQALRLLISQSGLTLGSQKIAGLWALSVLIAPVIAFALDKREWMYLAGAAGIGAVLPFFVIRFLRNRRVARFAGQFPDAIDMIVRSLKAGLVAREMPDPVGSEFGMVADELSFGLDLESAMRNMAMRIGQEDLPLFVTSISIQSATGGNLAAILEGLSKVIRDRFKMRRKITALSSEARMSGRVLIALPFIIFLMISAADPNYFDATRGKDETQIALWGSLCWMGIGVAFMRKLVNMKI